MAGFMAATTNQVADYKSESFFNWNIFHGICASVHICMTRAVAPCSLMRAAAAWWIDAFLIANLSQTYRSSAPRDHSPTLFPSLSFYLFISLVDSLQCYMRITHTPCGLVKAKSNLNSTYSQICNKYELKKVYLYFNRTQSCALLTYTHTHRVALTIYGRYLAYRVATAACFFAVAPKSFWKMCHPPIRHLDNSHVQQPKSSFRCFLSSPSFFFIYLALFFLIQPKIKEM